MGIITDILKDIPLSALLKERLTELEKKHESLEAENATLHAENARLKEQVAKLSGAPAIEETEKKILLLLAEREPLPISHIASVINEKKPKIEYYLQRMEEHGLLHGSHWVARESEYSLDQKGREFLVNNDLI